MARQIGTLAISGSIGAITYYRSRYGNFARKKPVISKENFATNPRFAKLRAQAADFGHVIKAGNLLRTAFRNMLKDAKDANTCNRLTAALFRVLKTDIMHPPGQRLITDGDLALLKKFEFNEVQKVSKTIYGPINTTIDRASGRISLQIPNFLPQRVLNPPKYATHFSITLGAAALDFTALTHTYSQVETGQLPLRTDDSDGSTLTAMLPPDSRGVMVIALGIVFFETAGGPGRLATPAGMSIIETSRL